MNSIGLPGANRLEIGLTSQKNAEKSLHIHPWRLSFRPRKPFRKAQQVSLWVPNIDVTCRNSWNSLFYFSFRVEALFSVGGNNGWQKITQETIFSIPKVRGAQCWCTQRYTHYIDLVLCLLLFPRCAQMIIATKQSVSSSAKSNREASGTEDDDSVNEVEIIEPAIGWAYVGSHNFTSSAWGTLSGSAFNPILNVSVSSEAPSQILTVYIRWSRSPIMSLVSYFLSKMKMKQIVRLALNGLRGNTQAMMNLG